MKYQKFLIRLKGGVYDSEAIHTETLELDIEGEHCLSMGTLQGYTEPMYIIKGSYVTNKLLPYFDLLHNYSVIEITSTNGEGRRHRNNHKRITLEQLYSYRGLIRQL